MGNLFNEREFYAQLVRLIDKDMKSKNITTYSLETNKEYIISKAQYFNLKAISKGKKNISRLSHKRLLELCEYLQIDLVDIIYNAPGLNKI